MKPFWITIIFIGVVCFTFWGGYTFNLFGDNPPEEERVETMVISRDDPRYEEALKEFKEMETEYDYEIKRYYFKLDGYFLVAYYPVEGGDLEEKLKVMPNDFLEKELEACTEELLQWHGIEINY